MLLIIPFKQADLFGMAAMLERKGISVPKTSIVALPTAGARKPLVEVTLKPGANVKPNWQFPSLASFGAAEPYLRNDKDSRERLAVLITSPTNARFPQVIANRLWKRFFGFGLVDSPGDWHKVRPSHPELLEYLGRELVLSGYDLKSLARLILNSHAYQRQISPLANNQSTSEKPLFAGPNSTSSQGRANRGRSLPRYGTAHGSGRIEHGSRWWAWSRQLFLISAFRARHGNTLHFRMNETDQA